MSNEDCLAEYNEHALSDQRWRCVDTGETTTGKLLVQDIAKYCDDIRGSQYNSEVMNAGIGYELAIEPANEEHPAVVVRRVR